MKITVVLEVQKITGPKLPWDEVVEVVSDEIPQEVFADETGYVVEVVSSWVGKAVPA